MIWESMVSAGVVVMAALWGLAVVIIGLGWMLGQGGLGQLGIVVCCMAAVMTVIRDNQRTRRMLRRPGEVVGGLRPLD